MTNGYAYRLPRRQQREDMTPGQQVGLLNDDMDANDRAHVELRREQVEELRALKRMCFGAIGTFGSAALFLAGNLVKMLT